MKIAILLSALLAAPAAAGSVTLLNASYDATRELYQDIDAAFVSYWKAKTGEDVVVQQSHAGSGTQARAVIEGLDADVATLAVATDLDMIHERSGLVPADWRAKLPHGSAPFYSTIVFLVRKGNPKRIRDWEDLARPGVAVVVPNPKTSGGARWSFLAAWGAALRRYRGDRALATAYIARLYQNAPVLDTGARAATTTFVERGIGDVLVGWESEARLTVSRLGEGRVELVAPKTSIRADTPAAVVEAVARRHGALAQAQAYLRFLFSPQAQELAARRFYRPTDRAVAALHRKDFAAVTLFTVESLGGWEAAQAEHFSEGGTFDRIYAPGITGR